MGSVELGSIQSEFDAKLDANRCRIADNIVRQRTNRNRNRNLHFSEIRFLLPIEADQKI